MGNQPLCGGNDPHPEKSQYYVCGRQTDFRNSTTINIVNHVPVVSGQPLNFQKQNTFKKVQRSAAQFCLQNELDASFVPIVARIIAYGHNNIFAAYRRLPESGKYDFLDQIRFLDIDFIDLLYHRYILGKRQPKPLRHPPQMQDFTTMEEEDKNQYIKEGLNLLKKKQVAFMFLCAGSSSRFLFQDKFLQPIEALGGKTMLELALQRLRTNLGVKNSEEASVPLIFACNTYNRKKIQQFLKAKKYFGFDMTKVRYLQVPMLPVLNNNGKLCITFEFKIIERPAGTLKCVEELLGSGVFQYLRSEEISVLYISGLENLNENPGDPLTVGMLSQRNLEIMGKCTHPIFETEELPRYVLGKDGKTYVSSVQELTEVKIPQHKLNELVEECPILMNSMAVKLNSLKAMVKNYENSMFLSQEFQAEKRPQNYYNFQRNRPVINESVVIFEKHLGNLLACTRHKLLLRVPRSEFIPVLSRKGNYSLIEGCKIFLNEK